MAKVAFSKIKSLFTRKMGLNLRKKQVKCYIWRIVMKATNKMQLYRLIYYS